MSYFAPNIPLEKHCFFDRHGGVSKGIYDSLNMSIRSQDDRENVLQNLNITAQYYAKDLSNLNIIKQGVSNKAIYVATPEQYKTFADGAVTDQKNIILAIRTADCAPILFYDSKNQVIGVAHAGWRGALRGIIENTLDLMLSHGAQKQDIAAAIGPCLQKQSFACQNDMLQEFLTYDNEYKKFFTPSDETHWLFDAQNFCISRLKKYGIKNISASDINTYTDENYFSYRRNCHQNLISVPFDYPTHLSTIML